MSIDDSYYETKPIFQNVKNPSKVFEIRDSFAKMKGANILKMIQVALGQADYNETLHDLFNLGY